MDNNSPDRSEGSGQLITQNRREVVLSQINELSQKNRVRRDAETRNKMQKEKQETSLVRAKNAFFRICEEKLDLKREDVVTLLDADGAGEFMNYVAEVAKRDMRFGIGVTALVGWFPIVGWAIAATALPVFDEKLFIGWEYLFHRKRLERYGKLMELYEQLKKG